MPESRLSAAAVERWEERFQLLVESVNDYGIFMLDPAGFVISWNAGAERIKGYKAEEIIGKHFSQFYPPAELAEKKPEFELEQALRHGRFEDEGWRLRKDGTPFWANVVITALRDPITHELRGFGKVIRDLTERRQAEERLRQSEEQFRLLVERVDEYAIFMLDPTGHVVTWNSGAEKAKGYTVEEIVGEHFERFYTPEDRAAGRPAWLLEQARRHGHVRDEGIRVKKDGTHFNADVLITAVRDESGTLRGFSKVTRDITDQIRSRELEASKIAAEKASRAKDDFLAVLSHELRTPLTPILATVGHLLENLRTLPADEVLESLQTVRRNTLLEARLIDDLLDITRIARDKIELRPEVVDIHAALDDAVAICQADITAKGLHVSREPRAQEHWSWADSTRIRQVFWNLINNAVKFTPEGGTIQISSRDGDPGRLVVEVRDSGIGIDAENAQRIFSPFEQGERTVTRQFGGLGLGLAITHTLVSLHKGAISVHSEGTGKGTTFRVELDSLPEAALLQQSVPPETPPRKLRLLMVDDHPDTQRIISRVLSKHGHKVETAGNLAEATALLRNNQFDLLMSDIGLPDGSGHDLMRSAKKLQPQIHGIALSGFGLEEDLRRSAEAGFDYHLTKPIDMQMLHEFIARIEIG